MLSQYSAPQDEYGGPVDELDRIGLAQDATAGIDLEGARVAIADLLVALGRDLSDPDLAETPQRVVRAFEEMLTARPASLTTFANTEGYMDLVIVKNIPFYSLCQHHLLPFRGVAHIGYLPGSRLIGLSKLARGLERFARDLQVQERLTVQTADWLMETLDARGAGVVLEAEHLCMSLRGVQATGTLTTTAAFRGELAAHGPLSDRFFSK
jgi:GTP cyclohydrolase I